MGITGNLETMQLSELLQWLSQSKKTGTLVIDSGTVGKRIFFDQGRIISSASTDPKEYLGQFMVSQGYITHEELTGAIQMQEKTGMMLGKILVSIGAIQEDDVHSLLRLKAEESIFDVFTWAVGSFEFLDGAMPQYEMIPISLDVTGLVLEGARRLDEWNRIRHAVPSMDAVPVSIIDDLMDVTRTLPPGDLQVLREVDDRSTVEDIRERTHSTDFFVSRVLFEAAQAKRIKVIPPPWKGRVPGERPAVAAVAAAPAASSAGDGVGGEIGAEALIAAARPHLDAERYEQALRHLRAARALEPHDRDVKQAVEEAEAKIRAALQDAGVKPASIPKLERSLEELTSSQLSRNEGFVLSRINGSYDIGSIIKISSLPELDALLAFWRLNRAGHLTFEAKG
jgi:hypothetical protein